MSLLFRLPITRNNNSSCPPQLNINRVLPHPPIKFYSALDLWRESAPSFTTLSKATVKGAHGLQKDIEEEEYFYETQLVRSILGKQKGIVECTTMEIAMRNNNQWPSYTIWASPLDIITLQMTYQENMGFRHWTDI